MRNSWYPRQKAEYVTVSNLNGVKPQNVAAERDFSFGMDTKETPVYQTMGTERDTVPHIQIRNLAVCLLPLLRLRPRTRLILISPREQRRS